MRDAGAAIPVVSGLLDLLARNFVLPLFGPEPCFDLYFPRGFGSRRFAYALPGVEQSCSALPAALTSDQLGDSSILEGRK